MKTRHILLLLTVALLTACRQAQVPAVFQQLQKEAPIYPDYTGVTIPVDGGFSAYAGV